MVGPDGGSNSDARQERAWCTSPTRRSWARAYPSGKRRVPCSARSCACAVQRINRWCKGKHIDCTMHHLFPCLREPWAEGNPEGNPALLASRLCSCIAAGLKHRSALRSFIEGAHLFIESNPKQRQEASEMNRSTPHMHAAIGVMWTIMAGWQMAWQIYIDGGACMVEDGGVWRMVVCGRCEDDDDGSGVCMAVGWWVTHMALVPFALKRS